MPSLSSGDESTNAHVVGPWRGLPEATSKEAAQGLAQSRHLCVVSTLLSGWGRPAPWWRNAPEKEAHLPRATKRIDGRAGIGAHTGVLTTPHSTDPVSTLCPPPHSTLQAPLSATSQLPLPYNILIIPFTLIESLACANPFTKISSPPLPNNSAVL